LTIYRDFMQGLPDFEWGEAI